MPISALPRSFCSSGGLPIQGVKVKQREVLLVTRISILYSFYPYPSKVCLDTAAMGA